MHAQQSDRSQLSFISNYLPCEAEQDVTSRGRLARLIEKGVIKPLPCEWADRIARLLVKKPQTETKEDVEEAEAEAAAAAQQFLINIQLYLNDKEIYL